MSLAKKIARNREKKAGTKIQKTTKQINRSEHDVRRAYIRQNVEDTITRLEAIQNVEAILLVAAHETFRFAKKRLDRLYARMKSHFDCIKSGYVTVEEICQILRDEAKMDIRDCRNPNVSHQQLIQYKVIDELSAAFLIGLLDEYGYKATLLHRVYSAAAEISEKLDRHEMNIQDLENILEKEAKFNHERILRYE